VHGRPVNFDTLVPPQPHDQVIERCTRTVERNQVRPVRIDTRLPPTAERPVILPHGFPEPLQLRNFTIVSRHAKMTHL
jgi:hypothetical protein